MTADRLRVTLVGPRLHGGGAERVLVVLAEGLGRRGHAVRVVTVYGDDGATPSSGIRHTNLDLGGGSAGVRDALRRNRARVRALRAELFAAPFDTAVSFLPEVNVLTLLASRGVRNRVVVTEHGDPRVFRPSLPWRALRRATYPHAGALVAPASGIAEAFGWMRPVRRAVIPNPVPHEPGVPPGARAGRERWVAGLGRLAPEKGFDLLLAAFARVATSRPEWNLVIWGDGPERQVLGELARRLGIGERVRFPGWTNAPVRSLAGADLFVLSSRSEGFGNSIVEAMHAGVAVVAFDCPTGPREILAPGEAGCLVADGNGDAMAEAMARLMDDAGARADLAARGRLAALRFLPEEILPQWEALLDRVARR